MAGISVPRLWAAFPCSQHDAYSLLPKRVWNTHVATPRYVIILEHVPSAGKSALSERSAALLAANQPSGGPQRLTGGKVPGKEQRLSAAQETLR